MIGRSSFFTALLAATVILGGCNEILGIHDGEPDPTGTGTAGTGGTLATTIAGGAGGQSTTEMGGSTTTTDTSCGDRMCAADETCESCPEDCGQCSCGDDSCNEFDSCTNCPADCGECGDNLLLNGGFEDEGDSLPLDMGYDGKWETWQNESLPPFGSCERVVAPSSPEGTAHVRCTVTDVGSAEEGEFVLAQPGLSITDQVEYEVSFWVRADTPRQMGLSVQPKEGTGSYGKVDPVNVGTEWEHFPLKFTASGVGPQQTDTDAKVAFWLLGSVGTLDFDDVRLITKTKM